MSVWWKAPKNYVNTKIERRLTVVCKLVIFLVLTEFRKIFIVRAPNGRSDDEQEKQDKKDYYEVCDSVLQSKC